MKIQDIISRILSFGAVLMLLMACNGSTPAANTAVGGRQPPPVTLLPGPLESPLATTNTCAPRDDAQWRAYVTSLHPAATAQPNPDAEALAKGLGVSMDEVIAVTAFQSSAGLVNGRLLGGAGGAIFSAMPTADDNGFGGLWLDWQPEPALQIRVKSAALTQFQVDAVCNAIRDQMPAAFMQRVFVYGSQSSERELQRLNDAVVKVAQSLSNTGKIGCFEGGIDIKLGRMRISYSSALDEAVFRAEVATLLGAPDLTGPATLHIDTRREDVEMCLWGEIVPASQTGPVDVSEPVYAGRPVTITTRTEGNCVKILDSAVTLIDATVAITPLVQAQRNVICTASSIQDMRQHVITAPFADVLLVRVIVRDQRTGATVEVTRSVPVLREPL